MGNLNTYTGSRLAGQNTSPNPHHLIILPVHNFTPRVPRRLVYNVSVGSDSPLPLHCWHAILRSLIDLLASETDSRPALPHRFASSYSRSHLGWSREERVGALRNDATLHQLSIFFVNNSERRQIQFRKKRCYSRVGVSLVGQWASSACVRVVCDESCWQAVHCNGYVWAS